MNQSKNIPIEKSQESFQSLASLREAHVALIKERRNSNKTAQFYSQVANFIRAGKETGAYLDSQKERQAAQSILDYWDNLLQRSGQASIDSTLVDYNADLAPDLPDSLCPYLGLYSFQEDNESVFYGRHRLIQALVNHLKTNRVLIVSGPSGSGKSSVVMAGLLPKIRSGALSGSETWTYLKPMVPGSNPLVNLMRVIRSSGGDDSISISEQANHFLEDAHQLTWWMDRLCPHAGVLFIDQFEEVFTLCLDENMRQAFIDNLVELVQSDNKPHIFILTMRTDFESYVARYASFRDLFDPNQMRVAPLNAKEIREAIENPAAQINLKFEDDLVNALIQDILGEPTALPLLQFTLLKLWERREHNQVSWAAYRQLGGARRALANSADVLYESLIPEEQVTMKRIMLRMVHPGDGLEVTSNRIRRTVLYHSGEAGYRVDSVLEKLENARLIRLTTGDTPEDDQLEVAHEALVRNWPTLVGWLEDERERMRRRLRFTAAAEEWDALGRDSGALWRGALLEQAMSFGDLDDLETEFIRASKLAEVTEEEEKEAARQAKILADEQRRRAELESQRAEEQAHSARRLRLFALILVVLFLLSMGAAYYAFTQQTEAKRQKAVAESAQATAENNAATAEAALAFAETNKNRAITANDDLQKQLATQAADIKAMLAQTQTPSVVTSLSATATPIEAETPTLGLATAVSSPNQSDNTIVPGQTITPAPVPPIPTTTPTLEVSEQISPEEQLNLIQATQTAVAQDDLEIELNLQFHVLNDSQTGQETLKVITIGSGPQGIIIIGGIHGGFAPSSVDLARQSIAHFGQNQDEIPSSISLFIVRSANPNSGYSPGEVRGRLNANNVDLNRNWPCGWESEDSYYDSTTGETITVSGGSKPLSEPETRSLAEFIEEKNPVAVVVLAGAYAGGLSQAGRCGESSQVSGPLAEIYGNAAGYPIAKFTSSGENDIHAGWITSWLDDQGIPAIIVLLPSILDPDLENNLNGIKAVLQNCQTGICSSP